MVFFLQNKNTAKSFYFAKKSKTKCCDEVMPFSSVSDMEFDLFINSSFANNKILSNCYSMNDDYFSPQQISELVCKTKINHCYLLIFITKNLAKNKN